MNKRLNSLVTLCLVALFGCTSGMYSSKVYVDKERNRLARRVRLIEATVERDLAAIRKCYAEGKGYLNPFLGEDRSRDDDCRTDWLSKWAEPRLPLSEAEALEGKSILAEFAEKFLPNAYANYEKKREALLLLQQVFNEEFPEPWTIKDSNQKWDAFNKVLEKFVRARTEYFICHDELLHYWYMYRFGVLGGADLAQIDAKPLAVPLYRECFRRGVLFDKVNLFEENARVFAVKYAPESNAVYQKMEHEFKQLDALIKEVGIAQRKMDSVRYYCTFFTAIEKRNELVRKMSALSKSLTSWYFEHKTMEKTSEEVAKYDREEAKKLTPFIKALPSYIKENVSDVTCIIPRSDMISIPGLRYKIQRTEVTQAQWEAVMGNNPSKFKGLNEPVENVSWDDCQKFIEKLNKLEGRKYRLPTAKEWEYACRADRGKRKIKNMGQKEPNAWGLYDMHGSVWEWCQDFDPSGYCTNYSWYRVIRGGGGYYDAVNCHPFSRNHLGPGNFYYRLGFRLALSQD